MPTSDYNDEEIINKLNSNQAGEVEAMVSYLLGKFRGMVGKIVTNFNGEWEADVNTVLHDSTTALVKKVQNGSYQSERAKLSTLFYTIAQNNWLNIDRQRSRSQKREKEYKLYYPVKSHVVSEAEKILHREEIVKLMANKIEQLDEECQKILWDFWMQDKPLKEIAEELEKSVDAVKKKHSRCFKKLQKLFNGNPEDYFS